MTILKYRMSKGHIIVKDGILSIRETGMDILGGTIAMNADYDTRDSLKPLMKADIILKAWASKMHSILSIQFRCLLRQQKELVERSMQNYRTAVFLAAI